MRCGLVRLWLLLVASLVSASTAAAAGWSLAAAPFDPAAQVGHAMVYDTVRSRSVAFVKGVTGSETWEWNGLAWELRTLAGPTPPARDGSAMAFDSVRGRAVLYGGRSDSGSKLGDTWEFDGTLWRRVATSPPSPGDLFLHAMAYDAARQVTVLFGGTRDEGTPLGETWLWNGTVWAKQEPAHSPPERFGHAMSFDAQRGVVVLFGGSPGSGQSFADTWVWTGSDWVQKNPAPSPPARARHAMAYDGARQRVVLFSGSTGVDTNFGKNDTWEWDGTGWSERTPATGAPPNHAGTAMDYDTARARTVFFGGGSSNDVWEWDGAAWTEKTPTVGPRPRAEAAMAFDPARQRAVLFGGRRPAELTFFALGDTYEWDGARWLLQHPADSPPARYGHGMIFDESRQHVLLFGGFDNHGTFLADSWSWNGAVWTELHPVNRPPARYEHAMAYDPLRAVTVVFGGSSGTPFQDTWEWNGTNWNAKNPVTKPAARLGAAMAFDSHRGRVVLFGGGQFGSATNETWEWDGTDWTGRSPDSAPPARANHAMVRDAAAGQIVLFGGQAGSRPTSDSWLWDGSNWSERQLPTFPPARSVTSMAFDGARNQLLLFGGAPDQGFSALGDTWSLPSAAPASGPANTSPVASAGDDLSVDSGTFVTLFGRATDPDGDPLSYTWARTGGTAPPVELAGRRSATATFTATAAGTHLFTLTVDDGKGGLGRDSVAVTVIATLPCNGSQTRSIPLVGGLNLIAVPLMPCGRAFTVRDLMKRTGAPFVARTVGSGRFDVFLPGLMADEWAIDGKHGCLLRMRSAGQLDVTGEFWP